MDSLESRERAYHALDTAAHRIGFNNYLSQRRNGKLCRYCPSPEHARIVSAMPDVLSGKISVNDAMAILHEYDVMQQRFA